MTQEQKYDTHPSQRIGNCYSPTAQRLHLSKKSGVSVRRSRKQQVRETGLQYPVVERMPLNVTIEFTPSQQFNNFDMVGFYLTHSGLKLRNYDFDFYLMNRG